MRKKIYLGDSVYAESDGNGIWLTTENGSAPSNRIYFEPEVLEALHEYEKTVYGVAKEKQ